MDLFDRWGKHSSQRISPLSKRHNCWTQEPEVKAIVIRFHEAWGLLLQPRLLWPTFFAIGHNRLKWTGRTLTPAFWGRLCLRQIFYPCSILFPPGRKKKPCKAGIITPSLEERIWRLNLWADLPRFTVRAGSRHEWVWAQSPSPSCHIHCSSCVRTPGPPGRNEGTFSQTEWAWQRGVLIVSVWKRERKSPMPKRCGGRGLPRRATGRNTRRQVPWCRTGNLGMDKLVLRQTIASIRTRRPSPLTLHLSKLQDSGHCLQSLPPAHSDPSLH